MTQAVTKRARGRPPIGDWAMSVRVTVRLTADDAATLAAWSHEKGLKSLSAGLRALIRALEPISQDGALSGSGGEG